MSSNSDVYNQIHDTLQIAKHIFAKCDATPQKFFISPQNFLARNICYYTGVDRRYVEQLLINSKEKKTFLDWLRYKEDKYETSLVSYERMRNIIIDQYVNKLKIPIKASIFKALEIDKNDQSYSLTLLKQDLNSQGFIWKRLPKSDKYIVVENMKQVSNRMKYLQQMKEYRKSNRVLIHIERTGPYYPLQRVISAEIVAVASPQLGFIDAYFPPKLQSLDVWLEKKLHSLPQNSVFVIQQSKRFRFDFEETKLPTMHSKKADMIAWLETYNIPYDSTLHRGELFALVEKHKVHCPPIYRIGEILKASGHDVLVRPPELNYTGYFRRIMKIIFDKEKMTLLSFKMFVTTTMNDTLPGFWLGEDGRVAAEEQEIYEEDLKLESVLDNLMEAVKIKSLSVSDLDECEDDELDSEFFNNVIFDAVPMVPKKRRITLAQTACLQPKSVELAASPSQSSAPGTSQAQPGHQIDKCMKCSF